MLHSPLHALVKAQGVADPGVFQSDNIRNLLLLILGFVLIIVAIGMAAKANKGNLKAEANTFGGVILAIIVAGFGATMMFVGFGEDVLGFLFGA